MGLFLRSGIWLALAAFLVMPGAVQAKGEKTEPAQAKTYIQELADEAIAILQAQDIDLSTREGKIRTLMEENLEIKLIGRFVLGRHWRSADAEQQEAYQALFKEFVLQTYSRMLGGYSGQTFRVTNTRTVGKRGDALVTTEILEEGAKPINAGWRVKTIDGRMRIVDVMAEGVSMAATQRSEFDSVVRRDGVDGLIEVLRVKVTKAPAQS